jgi:hypothetical protein
MAAKNIKLEDLKCRVLIFLQAGTKSGHFLCRRGDRVPLGEGPRDAIFLADQTS